MNLITHFVSPQSFRRSLLGVGLLGMLLAGCGPQDRTVTFNPHLDAGVEGISDLGFVVETPQTYPEATKPCNGYTLFGTPLYYKTQSQVSLVDMTGKLLKKWILHGFPAQMLPGGSVIATKRMRPGSITAFQDSIELVQVSWTGKEEWSFTNWEADGTKDMMSRQHHDYQRAGNPVGYYAPGQSAQTSGNTLILSHKSHTVTAVSDKPIQDDVILEVTPQGKITWTWYASDHIDELGFDSTARADIYNNPQMDPERKNGDWLHVNAMNRLGKNRWYDKLGDKRFHPDNILICSRNANLIAIIDRRSSKIVWRVGPEFDSGKPWSSLGQFVGQHHAHMIPHGLPGGGNVMIFDNGGISGYGGPSGYPRNGRLYSRVLEFNPVTFQKVWEYGGPMGTKEFLFSGFVSSAQRLPNGNTLITDGDQGVIIEVTWRSKKQLWTYESNVHPEDGITYMYRAYRIPPEWLPTGANPSGYKTWSSLYPPLN